MKSAVARLQAVGMFQTTAMRTRCSANRYRVLCLKELREYVREDSMELVASSTPGLVERAQAIQLLTTWDVLVRSVCRELADSESRLHAGLRADAALGLLCDWKSRAKFVNGRPTITFPPDCAELRAQVLAGENVCGSLMFLAGADTFSDVESDFVRIEEALTQYWERYRCPVPAPEIEPF